MKTDLLTPDVPAQILPRRAASSDDLKALGFALADWSEAELRPGGLLRFIDNIVLTELVGGDDPSEVVFAVLYAADDDEDGLTITRLMPPHSDPAAAAQLLVVACSFCGTVYSRRRAVESLRDAVPAALIEDVLIDGRSWDLP
jgi:hypothetical protein